MLTDKLDTALFETQLIVGHPHGGSCTRDDGPDFHEQSNTSPADLQHNMIVMTIEDVRSLKLN